MVRSKVKLTYIQDDSARRATYRKRSKGLMKKVSELSTLCGVQACSIVYGPYSQTPEVWPSQEGAIEVLTRFRNMPEYQQGVKMANQESFTSERIKKLEEQLAKHQMQNYCNDMIRVMNKRMRGEATSKASLDDLTEMESICDEKLKKIAARLEKVKRVNGMLGGNVNEGVEAYCTGEGEHVDERIGMRYSINRGNLLSEAGMVSVEKALDHAHGYERQLNGLMSMSYRHQGFNWNENSVLFRSPYDGASVNPNAANR